jgi:hypothetical protein
MIDVGSRNVKLVVASLKEREPLSMKDERQCRTRLQLGDKTFDQETKTQRPLLAADQDALARLVSDYQSQCERDGGRMVGAFATEWARKATNQSEIRSSLQKATGVSLEILSHEQEGRYGYLSATRGMQGKIVLDFGSRSCQLSYWPRDAGQPTSISLPLGIDEAGERFFTKKEYETYGLAKAAFLTHVRAGLGSFLQRIRGELKKGTVKPELLSIGETGDVPLAIAGRLWDATTFKGVDEGAYQAWLKTQKPTMSNKYGFITAVVPTRDITAMSTAVEENNALFEELRGDSARRIYGLKMMAFPAMVSMIATDLGIGHVVLVPQELSDGFIVEKLHGTLR